MRASRTCLALGKMKGLVIPPFTVYSKNGDVDISKIAEHIQIIEKMNGTAVFLGGTGSEGASQTIEERVAIATEYRRVFDATDSKLKLMLHVGATSLKESQQLAEAAETLKVDAIASVTPTFFKPANVNVMSEWMSELASAAPNTPFYYYHIPVITNLPATISVKKFLEVCGPKTPTLHGIKYTAMNLAEFSDLTQVAGGKYDIMAGLSEQMLAALAMGAKASVSVPYNNPFAMKYYHKILEQYNAGDLNGALKTQQEINKLTYLLQVCSPALTPLFFSFPLYHNHKHKYSKGYIFVSPSISFFS